jgi:dTMP kinase
MNLEIKAVQNKPYNGFFITIEGGEGSGKTTLSLTLKSELESKGYSVFHTREPGGTPLSEKLRALILQPSSVKIGDQAELLLFLAARAQHIEEAILPALHQGKMVICERFNDSSIAYQGCARHLGMNHVEELCHLACRGLKPDLTFFLDIDPELGLQRIKEKRKETFDRLEQEHLQFHKEVRQGYLHLADQYRERIIILDATLPIHQLSESALSFLLQKKS